jgi:hypothetical protein
MTYQSNRLSTREQAARHQDTVVPYTPVRRSTVPGTQRTSEYYRSTGTSSSTVACTVVRWSKNLPEFTKGGLDHCSHDFQKQFSCGVGWGSDDVPFYDFWSHM